MGFNAATEARDIKGTTEANQNTLTSYDKRAEFGPDGQKLISALSTGNTASDKYNQSVLDGKNDVNPEALIASNTAREQQALGGKVAAARAAGYRGGQGADLRRQSDTVSASANALADANNQLRTEAANRNNEMKAAAAGRSNASALGLLQLLRGEAGTANTAAKGTEKVRQTNENGLNLQGGLGFGN